LWYDTNVSEVHLYPEDWCSMGFWNVGTLPQHYTASQLRRWRQHGFPKHWYPTTTLHGVTTLKTSTWNITTMKASELALESHVHFTSLLPQILCASVGNFIIVISFSHHSCQIVFISMLMQILYVYIADYNTCF